MQRFRKGGSYFFLAPFRNSQSFVIIAHDATVLTCRARPCIEASSTFVESPPSPACSSPRCSMYSWCGNHHFFAVNSQRRCMGGGVRGRTELKKREVPYTYDGVYHTSLGTVFQARLLDNQEGADTNRYVFGKLSARCFYRRSFVAPILLQLSVEISTMEDRPRGGVGVVYTVYIYGSHPSSRCSPQLIRE